MNTKALSLYVILGFLFASWPISAGFLPIESKPPRKIKIDIKKEFKKGLFLEIDNPYKIHIKYFTKSKDRKYLLFWLNNYKSKLFPVLFNPEKASFSENKLRNSLNLRDFLLEI